MNYTQKWSLFMDKMRELQTLKLELLNPDKKELSFGERKLLQVITKMEEAFLARRFEDETSKNN